MINNNDLDILKDQLFQLVNSLTMSEKRYFTNSLGGDSPKKFLPVYNAICESLKKGELTQTYKKLERQKHFIQTKNYLFKSILKSLRAYHENNSIHNTLDNQIHEIDILINKELFKIAKKKIALTRKLASKYDSFQHLILLNKLESRVNTFYNKNSAQHLELELTNESLTISNKIQKEIEFTKLFLAYRNRYFSNREIDLEELIQNEFSELDRNEKNMSLKSKYYHYLLLANQAGIKGSHKLAINYLGKIGELMAKDKGVANNTNLDTITFFNYAQILNNYLQAVAKIDTEEEFFNQLNKLKSLKSKSLRENNKIALNTIILESDFYINRNLIDQGCEFAINNIEKLKSIEADPNRMEIAYFNLTTLLFYGGEYKLSARLAIRNIELQPFYKVLYRSALFIYILCQYELNNHDHGYYYLQRYNQLLQKDRLTEFDKKLKIILVNIFTNKHNNAKRHYDRLSNLLADKNFSQNQNINLNLYFNFSGWIEKKLVAS